MRANRLLLLFIGQMCVSYGVAGWSESGDHSSAGRQSAVAVGNRPSEASQQSGIPPPQQTADSHAAADTEQYGSVHNVAASSGRHYKANVSSEQNSRSIATPADNMLTHATPISVNPATGRLGASIGLFSFQHGFPVDFGVNYQAGSGGTLGLPAGWRFSMPEVIAGKEVLYNNQIYTIDEDWQDTRGHASGLRYMNNHGVCFTTLAFPRPLPAFTGDRRLYYYQLRLTDGTHYYFDITGKVIAQSDRFDNVLRYYYRNAGQGMAHNALTAIVSSLGQQVTFTTTDQQITAMLVSADGRQYTRTIVFGRNGIERYTNALGATTFFYYNNRGLLYRVVQPNGLSTLIDYTAISYKLPAADGQDQRYAFPAVELLQHTGPDGKVLSSTRYSYGENTDGRTYTGYPGYSLAPASRTLMYSSNPHYQYDVTVRQEDNSAGSPVIRKQVMVYNAESAPVSITSYANSQPVSQQVYEYELETNRHARTPNYNLPVVITARIYDPDRHVWQPQKQVRLAYDLYGNTTHTRYFNYDTARGFSLAKLVIASYDHTWNQPLSEESQIWQPIDGYFQVFRKENTLSADAKVVTGSQTTRGRAGNLQPWQQIVYDYNDHGWLTRQQLSWRESGHPGAVQSTATSWAYQISNGILTITRYDAEGHQGHKSYDLAMGLQTAETDAAGYTTRWYYNGAGQVTHWLNADGSSTVYTYKLALADGENSLTTTSATGKVGKTFYDALGRAIATYVNSDARAPATLVLKEKRRYNRFGEVAEVSDPWGIVEQRDYTPLGEPSTITDRYGNVDHFSYDRPVRQVTHHRNRKRVAETVYDPQGAVLVSRIFPNAANPDAPDYYYEYRYMRDGASQKLRQQLFQVRPDAVELLYEHRDQYDAAGRLVTTQDQAGDDSVAVDAWYDLLGNALLKRKTVRYADGRHFEVEREHLDYDRLGQLTTITDATGVVTRYDYRPQKHQTVKTEADGRTHTWQYDAMGRLVEETWQQGTDAETVTSEYDSDGRLVSRRLPGNEEKSVYNKAGQLVMHRFGDGRTRKFDYDRYGRVIARTEVDGHTTVYHYNDNNQLVEQVTPVGVIRYHYATRAEPDRNGMAGPLTGMDYRRQWQQIFRADAFNRPAFWQRRDAAGRILIASSQHYNQRGKIDGISVNSQISEDEAMNFDECYSYDGLGQLVSSRRKGSAGTFDTITYQYDGNGNILEKDHNGQQTRYYYNNLDQLTAYTHNGQNYRQYYDQSGNLVRDGKGQRYRFGLNGLLESVTTASGETVYYRYDPSGLRGRRMAGQQYQRFYYDENAVVTAVDEPGGMTGFVFGNGQRLTAYRSDTAELLFDYLTGGSKASTLALLGRDSQGRPVISATRAYEPYGAPLRGK